MKLAEALVQRSDITAHAPHCDRSKVKVTPHNRVLIRLQEREGKGDRSAPSGMIMANRQSGGNGE